MDITVGSFNVNNLFSRFNFSGVIDAIKSKKDNTVSITYKFDDPTTYKLRTFKGKLVKGKDQKDIDAIAKRIKEMDLDVLALQEVEDIQTLQRFVSAELGKLYPYYVLIEGNDPRLIDVALLSKLPIGGVTSWQKAVYLPLPQQPVFSRDLLQVEILNQKRTKRLFTLFNNHLKSHFVPFPLDPVQGEKDAATLRTHQADVAAKIIASQIQPASSFMVLGDMNDPPDSAALTPLVEDPGLQLADALTNAKETSPAPSDNPPAPAKRSWSTRFKPTGKPALYQLFDQIWLSPALAAKQTGAFIKRRTKLTGDGSDHDPVWIQLTM